MYKRQGREDEAGREDRAGRKKKQGEETFCLAAAMDEAFCFYYQENLELLRELGARIIPFSPLRDEKLPEQTDGILLGGGYPELYAGELGKNFRMRESIRRAAEEGMPILGAVSYTHLDVYKRQMEERPGLLLGVMEEVTRAASRHLKRRAGEEMEAEAILFTNERGVLGRTPGADRLLARIQQREMLQAGKEI